MAYPYLPGSGSEAFKGLSVLVGVMISIGASGIVGQAAGGLMITYTHTLRLGEYVRIGDTEGTVTDLGIFATRVRTGMGEEVTLPNAYVVANTIKNYSRVVTGGHGFVLDTQVTIGYATPWRQVHAMLLQAAQRTAGLLAEPKPFVVQTALSDFYVEYRLVCYAGPEAPQQRALALDALHANIQDVFNEYGVQIMSPHYMMDPAQPQVVPKEKWYAPPAQPPGHATGERRLAQHVDRGQRFMAGTDRSACIAMGEALFTVRRVQQWPDGRHDRPRRKTSPASSWQCCAWSASSVRASGSCGRFWAPPSGPP